VLRKEALLCQLRHQVLVQVQNPIRALVLVLALALEWARVKVHLPTRLLVVAKALVAKQMKKATKLFSGF
jgi:hypothetical protein